MFDFKIKENSVIDLALVPSPLVVVEVLLRKRLEEGVVVANDNAAEDTTENSEGKGGSETSQLEPCLLGCGP
jgi:hypothetical protein